MMAFARISTASKLPETLRILCCIGEEDVSRHKILTRELFGSITEEKEEEEEEEEEEKNGHEAEKQLGVFGYCCNLQQGCLDTTLQQGCLDTAATCSRGCLDIVFATISPSSILCKNAIICCFEGPISSYEKVKEVEEFFASRAKPLIARTLKQSIERVEINAKWVETCRNEKKMV
ncbi:aminopeptidase M1 [Tanacetum coccineum]